MAPYKLHFAMMSSLQTCISGIHSAIPTWVIDFACRAGDKFSTNAPANCLDIDFSSEVERMTACSGAAEDRLQKREIKTQEVTNGKNERCRLMKRVGKVSKCIFYPPVSKWKYLLTSIFVVGVSYYNACCAFAIIALL